MLEHLEIRNYALIENLSIDFCEGFNVITGETGSGKSIILGALGLLMGEKADSSAVRTGCDEITINAVVSIPENHEILPWLLERSVEPEDGLIYIRRTVKANGGRSLIYVQNQLFSRSDLCHLAELVIDMHGQSEHQSLLKNDRQRKILDRYAQNESLLEDCFKLYKEMTSLCKKKEDLTKQLREGQMQKDFLEFALDEIDKAKLLPDEDDVLKEKIKILGQSEAIYDNVQLCTERLKDVRASIFDALSSCAKAAKVDNSLNTFTARLESAQIEAEDIASELRSYLEEVTYSESEINNMQDRLSLIQKLKRKYGPTLKDVLDYAQKARSSLDLTENFEKHLEECDKAIKKAKEQYEKCCLSLRESRIKASRVLEEKIEKVLRTLGMAHAVFKINVSETKSSLHGSDQIEFMISANTGEPLKEIKAIASGGELSRVMLSLKTVLANEDEIQIQVFDEVDSGIGGSVALSLAECISNLSKTKQVIAITHLASIASVADSHMVVSKTVENGRTYTHLKEVSGEDRVHEIARMLSGDESNLSLSHARSMLKLT